MIQFLPLIFKALTGAPALIEVGKVVFEAVTGSPSTATTPEALQGEVEAMPQEQRAAWAEQMKVKVDIYQAETERLVNEQGVVTDGLIDKLDTPTADKIALLRMTTRPKVVLRMSHFLMVPLYIMALDGFLALCNTFILFRHTGEGAPQLLTLLASTFFAEGSIYLGMYQAGVTPAATIVVSYMTLRQIEKAGHPNPLASAGNAIKGLLAGLRK